MKSILFARRRGISAKVVGSGAPVISIPSGLSVSLSGSTATLYWTNNAGVTAQTSIEHSLTGTSGWAETLLTAAAAQTADITGLTAGPHYFRLRSKVGTDYSDYAVQTLNVVVVFNVSNFAASVSGTTVNLSWDAHNAGLAQTVIERSSNSGATWSVLSTVAAGTNTYASTGNASGAYLYRARALISGTYSPAYTSTASATVVAVSAPSSFAASVSGSTITLSWTDTNSGAAQTVIERSTDSGATWSALITVAAGTNSYANAGLSPGAYSYRARGLIGTNYSASYTSTASATVAGAFVLDALYDFTSLGAAGTALQDFNTSDGGQFQMVTKGGFGSYISNAQTRGGRATSLRTTIKAGTFGYGDVSDTTGRFGFNILFPNSIKCVEGDTLHMIFAIFFDSNFNSYTNTGILKFLRFLGNASTSTPYGNLDHCIVNDYGYVEGDTPTGSPNWMHGLMWGNEANHAGEVWQSGYGFVSGIKTNRNLTRGQWCVVEHRQKFSSNPALASRTTWIDGQFVADFTGNTKTYINASGVLTTLTGGQVENIAAGVTIDMCRLFTYFNNASQQDQGVWVDRVGFYRIPSGSAVALPNTDAYGNKFLGLGVI